MSLKDFWDFLSTRKSIGLFPILLMMLALGALLVFAQEGSAIAPFIYTLF